MRRLVLALVLLASACSGEDKLPDDTADRTTTTPPLLAEEELDDGTHFGFVTALDPAQFRLAFDPAELLEGDEAIEAAEEDGGVVTEGGSYVRNPDDRMNRITIDEDLVVRLLKPLAPPDGAEACCELREVPFEDWLAGFTPDDRTFYGTAASRYEITIEDGKVVTVDEVYIP